MNKWVKRWIHKLFRCPTFWRLKPFYHCPRCGKGMRCYWDGNDIARHGIDYCDKCAKILEEEENKNDHENDKEKD